MNNQGDMEKEAMRPEATEGQAEPAGNIGESKETAESEKKEESKNTGQEEENKNQLESKSGSTMETENNFWNNGGMMKVGIAAVAFLIGFMLAYCFRHIKKRRGKNGEEEKRDGYVNSGLEEEKEMSRSAGRPEKIKENPFYSNQEKSGSSLTEAGGTAVSPEEIQDGRHPGIYVGKAHNIGRRDSQQDSFGMSRDVQGMSTKGKGILAIVADGMGGTENGDQVSVLAAMTMLQNFDRMEGSVPGEKRLLTLMNQANTEVNKMLLTANGKKGGSTLVSVLIQDAKLYWLTIGDSRLCLYRKNTLIQINREHVYGIELDEKAARGEISMYAAANDPQRKALTSYIGMEKITKIDRNIRPLQMEDRDRLILMSDGVFGTLTDEEIAAAMQLPVTNSGEAIDQMIQKKNRREQDNYTVLILEYIRE